MTSDLYPLQVLLVTLAGWVNRHQQHLIRSTVQLAEAEVAVGDERAHAEFGSQDHGGAVVRLGRCHVGRVGERGDLAKQVERPGLVPALLMLSREVKGTQSASRSLLRM